MRKHALIFVCCLMFPSFIKSASIKKIEMHRVERDTLFDEYRDRAHRYLSRSIFNGTQMSGEMLASCAKHVYSKYGVFIPVELALAQAQLETRMGTGGRAGHKTNPFNLGEWADRSTLQFKTTEEGVMAYYDLLARRYFTGGRTLDDLYKCFIDIDGFYYGLPDYGQEIKKHVQFVQYWLDNN